MNGEPAIASAPALRLPARMRRRYRHSLIVVPVMYLVAAILLALLDLAFEEIRDYGARSVQICRRLRAVLEDLLASTPPERHPAIEARLGRLDAAVQSAFPEGSPELATAMVADPTGLGRAR